ncbi:MAG: hypothetical protein JWQ30_2352 [Sediminibacterium sp.]|nr:hypothetical protein [Sediminibacterium sp.]
MCFSATASFMAGSGLLLIGVAAVTQSRNIPQKVFACIPLVFAIQQLSEGVVWLSISHDTYAGLHNLSMYTFLVFAQAVWPVLIPLSVLLFEKDRKRKKILYVLFAAGLFTALYLICGLVIFPVSVSVEEHHLKYHLDFPRLMKWVTDIAYMSSAALSPFVSSDKRVRFFGWMLLSSYILTTIFYQNYLASVWCYCAAVLSFTILFIIRGQNKAVKENRIG